MPSLDIRGAGIDVVVGTAIVSAVFIVLAVIAWLYPPSNSDSLAYHLARIEHWIQNESVGSYAAHFLHQIEYAPLMEYNLATLHLLAGTDRLDGYVQLGALLVCALGASDLARRLGMGARGQVFTALLVVTVPSALLQATSTTNDVFGGAVVMATLWVASAPLGDAGWKRRSVALGVAAGLIEISKGTGLALFGPVIAVLLVVALRSGIRAWGVRVAVRRAAGSVAIAVVAAVLVAGPFLARNIAIFGGPAGPMSTYTVNDGISPVDGAGNSVRQVSAQFLIGDGSGPQHVVSEIVVGALVTSTPGSARLPRTSATRWFPTLTRSRPATTRCCRGSRTWVPTRGTPR